MFKQIFRITFVTLIWKQYKQVILSTVLLFAYLWLVGSIHADYLTYLNGQNTGFSFVVKWLAFAAGVGLYLGYHYLRNPNKSKIEKQNSKKAKQTHNTNDLASQDDPFDALRTKEKLRTRAEITIEKSQAKN